MEAHTKNELHGFLRFAKFKREQHLKEVTLAFQDVVDFKLEEEIYNKEDVKQLLGDVKEEVSELLAKEVTNFSHTAALMLRECLEQAAAHNVSLRADTNRLEDEAFLREIATAEVEASKAVSQGRGGRLGALGSAQAPAIDPAIRDERDAARRDAARLQDQFKQLQTSTQSALDDRSTLRAEVDSLKQELAAAREEAANARKDAAEASQAAANARTDSARQRTDEELLRREREDAARMELVEAERKRGDEQIKKYKNELKRVKAELESKSQELESTSSEAAGRVSESRQFQQMKKMMAQKSQQLQEVRRRLAKYEPDDTPLMEDD